MIKNPSFRKGDINSFRKYVVKNLTYPVISAENKVQGEVIILFYVNSLGYVDEVFILSTPDEALGHEAKRVI